MTNSGRTAVKLQVQHQDIDLDAENGLVQRWSDNLLSLSQPLPDICPRHGEPEVERRQTNLMSEKPTQDMFQADEAPRFMLELEWPSCGQCLRRQTRWRWASLAVFLAAVVPLLVVIGLAQAGISHPAAVSGVVFGGIALLLIAAKIFAYGSTFSAGVLASDGSAFYIPDAHPDFVKHTVGELLPQHAKAEPRRQKSTETRSRWQNPWFQLGMILLGVIVIASLSQLAAFFMS